MQKSLRITKGTTWSGEEQLARIGAGMLFPKDTDNDPHDSEAPPVLLNFIE